MSTPTPEMKWSASPSYDFTGTFVAYVKEGDNTVLQTRCSSYEEADRIARTVVEAVNARLSPAEAERIREALESLLLNYQQGHAACPDHQPDICMACRGREALALLEKAAGGQ